MFPRQKHCKNLSFDEKNCFHYFYATSSYLYLVCVKRNWKIRSFDGCKNNGTFATGSQNLEGFWLPFEHNIDVLVSEMVKYSEIFGFVTVFNLLVLEAPKELFKKSGHFDYLLLAKRSFPGSFVS